MAISGEAALAEAISLSQRASIRMNDPQTTVS